MRLSMFANSDKFSELLNKQNNIMLAAVTELDRLFHDPVGMEDRCICINQLDDESQKISRATYAALNVSSIKPADSDALYTIDRGQREMVSLIRAISTRVALYQFKELRVASLGLVHKLKEIIGETGGMLEDLQAGKSLAPAAERVQAAQNEASRLVVVALSEVLETQLTGAVALLNIIKWTHIYDRIEQAINKAENLANIFESISIKHH